MSELSIEAGGEGRVPRDAEPFSELLAALYRLAAPHGAAVVWYGSCLQGSWWHLTGGAPALQVVWRNRGEPPADTTLPVDGHSHVVPPVIAAAIGRAGAGFLYLTRVVSQGQVTGWLGCAAADKEALDGPLAELLKSLAPVAALVAESCTVRSRLADLLLHTQQERLIDEDDAGSPHRIGEVVGRSPALLSALCAVDLVAPSDATVLIQGETGTGKELIARAIHRLGARSNGPFVLLNCAAIPAGLLESELFGHEKGAFTGAISQRIGRFELAHRGTLFLDEIGELPLELQPKLLRALQERAIERVGGSRTIEVDVRIVAASNLDLRAMKAQNRFRADLFYRLNVFPIMLPPLRERREDIPLLVRHFVAQIANRSGKRIETIPNSAMAALCSYDWPGNIRELENLMERSVILTRTTSLHVPVGELALNGCARPASLAENERDHILRVLDRTNWRISGPRGAAVVLGLKRTTLYSRMNRLGIARAPKAA